MHSSCLYCGVMHCGFSPNHTVLQCKWTNSHHLSETTSQTLKLSHFACQMNDQRSSVYFLFSVLISDSVCIAVREPDKKTRDPFGHDVEGPTQPLRVTLRPDPTRPNWDSLSWNPTWKSMCCWRDNKPAFSLLLFWMEPDHWCFLSDDQFIMSP